MGIVDVLAPSPSLFLPLAPKSNELEHCGLDACNRWRRDILAATALMTMTGKSVITS